MDFSSVLMKMCNLSNTAKNFVNRLFISDLPFSALIVCPENVIVVYIGRMSVQGDISNVTTYFGKVLCCTYMLYKLTDRRQCKSRSLTFGLSIILNSWKAPVLEFCKSGLTKTTTTSVNQ